MSSPICSKYWYDKIRCEMCNEWMTLKHVGGEWMYFCTNKNCNFCRRGARKK